MGGAAVLLYYPRPQTRLLRAPAARQSRARSRKNIQVDKTHLYDPATSGRDFAEQHTQTLPTVGSTRFCRKRRKKALNHHLFIKFLKNRRAADAPFIWHMASGAMEDARADQTPRTIPRYLPKARLL